MNVLKAPRLLKAPLLLDRSVRTGWGRGRQSAQLATHCAATSMNTYSLVSLGPGSQELLRPHSMSSEHIPLSTKWQEYHCLSFSKSKFG